MSKLEIYQDESGEYGWKTRHDDDSRGDSASNEDARGAVVKMTASGPEIEVK
jgi:hypothetical protein